MIKDEELSCPVQFTLALLNRKWALAVLEQLLTGTKRFKELERLVAGITPKMLVQELKDLEERKIIVRKIFPEVPPRVEYTLSDSSWSLLPLLNEIEQWGTNHLKLLNQREVTETTA